MRLWVLHPALQNKNRKTNRKFFLVYFKMTISGCSIFWLRIPIYFYYNWFILELISAILFLIFIIDLFVVIQTFSFVCGVTPREAGQTGGPCSSVSGPSITQGPWGTHLAVLELRFVVLGGQTQGLTQTRHVIYYLSTALALCKVSYSSFNKHSLFLLLF